MLMGLFDKVKTMLNIGGVKVSMQAPSRVANNGTLPVTVMLMGGKMAQNIQGVNVRLVMLERQASYGMNRQSTQNMKRTVLSEQSASGPLSIQPGEQKTFSVELSVQIAGPAGGTEGVMGALNKLNDMATKHQREWMLEATAAIEGSADARATQVVSVTL